MKFLDLFNEIEKGDFGLTEEMVYQSLDSSAPIVPLYGGNQSHSSPDRFVAEDATRKDGKRIRIFSGECIILSLDGSSGSMTYKNGERFALNHHAGVITAKKNSDINLEFFALFFSGHYKNLAVSDGSKTLSLNQIYDEEIELPKKSIQDRIVKVIKDLQPSINSVREINERIQHIEATHFSDSSVPIAKNVPICEVLNCMSGNSGLTEEFIYYNLPDGNGVEVLSAATTTGKHLGYVNCDAKLKGRPIKIFDQGEGLLVIRKGKAGYTQYLPKGKYAINDDAYILYKKESCQYEISLRWIAISYRDAFLQYASSSDNGTWNKTGFMDAVKIDIPSILDQNKIVKEYERLRSLKSQIAEVLEKYNSLFDKVICN